MEALWEDLRRDFEQDAEISQEIRDLLDARYAAYERGEVRLLEWNEAMDLLQQQVSA